MSKSLDLKVNLNAFVAKDKKARAQVKRQAADYIRYSVKRVLKDVLQASPQFTGDYVFNWVVEYGGPGTASSHTGSYDSRFKWNDWKRVPNQLRKRKGDRTAIDLNLATINPASNLAGIHWNSTIRLVNYAPVAPLIEMGGVEYRPENLGVPSAGMRAYIKAKYPKLVR